MIETVVIMIIGSIFGYAALVSLAKEGKTGCAVFAWVVIVALIIYFLFNGVGGLSFIVIPFVLAFIFLIKILMDIFE